MDGFQDDLYVDTFRYSANGSGMRPDTNRTVTVMDISSTNSFFRLCMAILLRAGFIMVQIGTIPTESVYIILLHNILDISLATIGFGLIGYIWAFGTTTSGYIGLKVWINSDKAGFDEAIIGFSACLIATGLITSMLCARLHIIGYIVVTFIYASFFQPILMHWCWHPEGWMNVNRFRDHDVAVKDHGGCLVMHISGALVGLVGAIYLGRRLVKLAEIDDSSIGTESPGTTSAGYAFIALGLIAFTLPSAHYDKTHMPENYIGVIIINNILAFAAGLMSATILNGVIYRNLNYWIILRCFQGGIAGLVSISSGADVFNPLTAFLVGFFGGALCLFTYLLLEKSSIEDYCNITAIHLACGIYGCLASPIFGIRENLGLSVSSHVRLIHSGWQVICCSIIILLTCVVFAIVFGIITLTNCLRNQFEIVNHERAGNATVPGPKRCYFLRLFKIERRTALIAPGTTGRGSQVIALSEQNILSRRRRTTNPEKINILYKNRNDVAESNDNSKEKIAIKRPKPRSAYTISNIMDALELEKLKMLESPHAMGDRKPSLCRSFENVRSVHENIHHDESYIELRKSKKYMDLITNTNEEGVIKLKKYKSDEFLYSNTGYFLGIDDKTDGFIQIQGVNDNLSSDVSDECIV